MIRVRVFAALAVLAAAGEARADGRFQVEPTRVDLSSTAPSGAVIVTNRGGATLRLQATAFRWTESPEGAMQLVAAPEVVVRPALFEIPPGKSRTVRVGTTATAGPAEQSYRVFVEELPDHSTPQGAGVRVLTRIGVPVFVAPRASRTALELQATRDGDHASVVVNNTGTVHVKLLEIKLRAARGGGERTATGWYVLPGASRRFALTGAPPCAAGDTWLAEATSEDGAHFVSAPIACRP